MLCRIYGQGWDPKDIVTCNLTLDLKVTVCFIWGDLSDHQTSDWVDVLTKNSPVIWWNIAGGLRWRGLVASGTGEALSWIQEVQFEEQICDPEGLSGAKQLSYRILQIFLQSFAMKNACHVIYGEYEHDLPTQQLAGWYHVSWRQKKLNLAQWFI